MSGSIQLVYVKTTEMVGDIFTKALAYEAFARHASYLKGQLFPELQAVQANAQSARKRTRDEDV